MFELPTENDQGKFTVIDSSNGTTLDLRLNSMNMDDHEENHLNKINRFANQVGMDYFPLC